MSEPHLQESFIDSASRVLSRRKWWLICGFLLIVPAAGMLIMSLPSMYRSTTLILIGQDSITESLVTSTAVAEQEQRLHVVQQELLAREQLLELIARFDLYTTMLLTAPEDEVIQRMRQDIAITQTTTSQLNQQRGVRAPMEVRISYQSWDPVFVAEVTNTLAALHREKYESIRLSQASRTTAFLREQLNSVAMRMDNLDEMISAFNERHLGELPQQLGVNLASLERLNAELRINAERQLQLSTFGSEGGSQNIPFGSLGSVVGESRIELLQRELAVMSSRYNNRHPGIMRLSSEIARLENESQASQISSNTLDEQEDSRSLRAQESRLRRSLAEVQATIQAMPAIEQELTQLMHRYGLVREEHAALLRRYQEADLSESLQIQQNHEYQIMERALVPNFPIAPDRTRLIFMVLVLTGALLGGVVMLAEQLKRTFHTVQDLRRYTLVPVVGTVAMILTKGDRVKRSLSTVLISVAFIVVIVMLVLVARELGQSAYQLVWATAGANR